jgi:hypothetical protein
MFPQHVIDSLQEDDNFSAAPSRMKRKYGSHDAWSSNAVEDKTKRFAEKTKGIRPLASPAFLDTRPKAKIS